MRHGCRVTKRAANVSFRLTEIKPFTDDGSMPNFEVRITAGATRAIWTDPADGDRPSRLNSDERRPHSYRQVTVGDTVTVSAIVDGVTAPLDAALGGNLFLWWLGEVPTWPAPALLPTVGQSSVVSFTPEHVGHHLLVCFRSDGGRVLVPLDAIGT
jgi:hypothetical protein